MIEELKYLFGSKGTAVTLNKPITENVITPHRPVRFCEAVYRSFRLNIRLNDASLGCLGALRSAGFQSDDTPLLKEITEHSQIREELILPVLNGIPYLSGIHTIDLGPDDSAGNGNHVDMYIFYVKPVLITGLMHRLTRMGEKLEITPYSFLSVCGNILAKSLYYKKTTISFGCPESRKYGGIGKNEVVVGIPFRAAEKLTAAWQK